MREETYFDAFSATFRSPRTRAQYAREIEQFEDLILISIADCDRRDVESYVSYLTVKEIRASTIAKKLHILSSFCQYLVSEGRRTDDPFLYSYAGRVTYRTLDTSQILPKEETDVFFEAVRTNGDLGAAMVGEVILATGCSLEEALKLKSPDDVVYSPEQNRFSILFHNYAPFQLLREISLPDTLSNRFLAYLETLPEHGGPLFLNQQGKPLSAWSVQYAYRKAGTITARDLKVSSKLSLASTGLSDKEFQKLSGSTGRWDYRYRKAVREIPPSPLNAENRVGGGG